MIICIRGVLLPTDNDDRREQDYLEIRLGKFHARIRVWGALRVPQTLILAL